MGRWAIIIICLVWSRPSFALLDGGEFLALRPTEQSLYAQEMYGALSGGLLYGGSDHFLWVAECGKNWSGAQLAGALSSWFRDRPSSWDEVASASMFYALARVCPNAPRELRDEAKRNYDF